MAERIDLTQSTGDLFNESVESALRYLRAGEVIIAASEHGYVYLANAFDKDAVNAIHILRGNSAGITLQVFVKDKNMARGVATGLTLQQPSAPAAPAPKAEQLASPSVTLPFVGTMPLPSKEAMAIATTTAVAATFVAVLGKAAFEASLEGIRPVLRLLLIRYKKLRNRDLSEAELQLEFAFEMDKKRKGKRTFGQAMADLRDYLRENFLEDLIGS